MTCGGEREKAFSRVGRFSRAGARVFVYLSSFISQILDLLYGMVYIFIFHCVKVQTDNITEKSKKPQLSSLNFFRKDALIINLRR